MNNKRKAGFSMVEVIISLAIIVMISITAISITLSSFANRMTVVNRTHAQYFADNVWECFKAADGYDKFLKLVEFSEGLERKEERDGGYDVSYKSGASMNIVTIDGGAKQYTYSAEAERFEAILTVNYPDSARPTLSVTVTEADGDEIISFTYEKGAK